MTKPKPLLIGAPDLRAFALQQVFTIGGVPVTLPAEPTQGAYDVFDVETALNGRGSAVGKTLGDAINSEVLGTQMTAGVDGSDHIYIESDNLDFALQDSPLLRKLGWPNGAGLVGGAAPFRQTAPNLWQLGELYTGDGITLTPSGGASRDAADQRWWPNVIAALRVRGSGDADDLLPDICIEQVIHDAIPGDEIVNVGLVDGYFRAVWNIGGDLDATFVLNNQAFGNKFGLTGLETVVVDGDTATLTADRIGHHVQVLEDGIQEIGFETELVGDAMDATDGNPDVDDRGRFGHVWIRAFVGGRGHYRENYRHWMHRARPHAGRGLSLYLSGTADPRRNLDPYDVTAAQPAHDLVYTVGRGRADGYGARFPAHLDVDTSQSERVDFPTDRQVRGTIEVTLSLGRIDGE